MLSRCLYYRLFSKTILHSSFSFRPKYILHNEGGKKGMKIMLYVVGFLVSWLMASIVLLIMLVMFEVDGFEIKKMTNAQIVMLKMFVVSIAIITALIFGGYVL